MKIAVKKKLARELYMLDTMTQKEIAERVGVTPNTLGKWVKKEKWNTILAASLSTKHETLARIDKAISDVFDKAEEENRKLDSGDYDALSKLQKVRNSIDKEISLDVIIEVFTEYNTFLMAKNPELARENNKFQDQFVNLKASGTK